MGIIKKFNLEKLIIGILISNFAKKAELLHILINYFGPIDFQSDLLDFNFTTYYNREMGIPIKRFFISFDRLIPPQRLSHVKLTTNSIESIFKVQEKRKINLDPGLLSMSRFILASTKDSSHRIPLVSGIYGEITLMYESDNFRPVEWTYKDYKSTQYLAILKKIRKIYMDQMKSREPL